MAPPTKKCKIGVRVSLPRKCKTKANAALSNESNLPEAAEPPKPRTLTFWSFPREIRDKIYGEYLHKVSESDHGKEAIVNPVGRSSELALLKASRAIREEVAVQYYRDNNWRFVIDPQDLWTFHEWLEDVGVELTVHIRHVWILLDGGGWSNPATLLKAKEEYLPHTNLLLINKNAVHKLVASPAKALSLGCKMAADLRVKGLSWDDVEDTLEQVRALLDTAGCEFEWDREQNERLKRLSEAVFHVHNVPYASEEMQG